MASLPRKRAPKKSRQVPGSVNFSAADTSIDGPTNSSRSRDVPGPSLLDAEAGMSARQYKFKPIIAPVEPPSFVRFPSPPLFQFTLPPPNDPNLHVPDAFQRNALFDFAVPMKPEDETPDEAAERYDKEFDDHTRASLTLSALPPLATPLQFPTTPFQTNATASQSPASSSRSPAMPARPLATPARPLAPPVLPLAPPVHPPATPVHPLATPFQSPATTFQSLAQPQWGHPTDLPPPPFQPLATPVSNLSKPISGWTEVSSTPYTPASQRAPPTPHRIKIAAALAGVRDARVPPVDLLLEVLDPEYGEHDAYRREFYKDGSSSLEDLLDLVMQDPKGKAKLRAWMQPHALELMCETVYKEMDVVKTDMSFPSINKIPAEFFDTWSLENTVIPTAKKAPCLSALLASAAQTRTAKAKNKIKDPSVPCDIIIAQLGSHRSNKCLTWSAEFGLCLFATGCSKQVIEILYRCGMCPSYDSILKLVEKLGDHCIAKAIEVASGPHVFCYDNINVSTSKFVEQRGAGTPAKAQSGCFSIVYKLYPGAKEEDMRIAPMMQRLKNSSPLDFYKDILPTTEQSTSVHHQLKIAVVRILTTYSKPFQVYAKDPKLQNKRRRQLADGHVTQQFPLRASVIDEATILGNLKVQDDSYTTQLKQTDEDLCERAGPSFNDQKTNAGIRGAQVLRARDTNAWTRREVLQLAFGLFHLCMNLIWALLHIHRGSLGSVGSLTHFFSVMEKVRLSNEKPDYHTLLASLTQILDGLILNAWRTECGFDNFQDFYKSNPTPEQLLFVAQNIIHKYAQPMPEKNPTSKPSKSRKPATTNDLESDPPSSSDEDEDEDEVEVEDDVENETQNSNNGGVPPPLSTAPPTQSPDDDIAHRNLCLLTHDLLIVTVLIRAISDGDIGRVEDLLPTLCFMFRGAGSKNYCFEILHFIFSVKNVWTPEFANIMRDNMLVNISGLPGHWMGIDLNIEHIIGYLKAIFLAKGLRSSWDRLGNTSAAVVYLQKIKKQLTKGLAKYRGSSHTTPDTSGLVWKVANKVKELNLQTFVPGRDGNSKVKRVIDIVARGEEQLKSTTLGTFNTKMFDSIDGKVFEDEVDTLPPIGFAELEMDLVNDEDI